MDSIFAKQRAKANLQRNAFDLSRTEMFTASCGMLLPCFVQECNPNEHFEISPSSFLRTMPLNTAAFTRLKQYVDFYFVPYRVLLRQFPQFIVGTEYNISSISQLNAYTGVLPYLTSTSMIGGILKDAFSEKASSSSVQTDILGYPLWRGTTRLLDLLGYGFGINDVTSALKEYSSASEVHYRTAISWNPFRLAAYQKIYFDYFRNTDYELNKPSAYNLDVYFAGSGTREVTNYRSGSNFQSVNELFSLRYCNYKKDYFQGIKPSFQGTDYLSNPITAPNFGGSANWFVPNTDTLNGNSIGQLTSNINTSSSPALAQITVANLRSAFALDKLYRLSIAAGDGDYASQIRAHYGFNAPVDDYKSTYIGGIDAPITISEVVTTATTEQAPTGDIYGKGMSSNRDSTFSYDTKEHGVIMGIFRVVPENLYAGTLSRFNQKLNREDYYQPEFADLGNQPISDMEYSPEYISAQAQDEQVVGFLTRYAEYKTAIDSVHGELFGIGSLASWTTPNLYSLYSGNTNITASYFKVNPSYTNPIKAGLQYDGKESNDMFLVNLSVGCKSIRPMSVDGLPAF